jgi:hypothetical protein
MNARKPAIIALIEAAEAEAERLARAARDDPSPHGEAATKAEAERWRKLAADARGSCGAC